jgi:D-alanyl-D-alanine carboxypeptidase/D-alanyl-D-alanine-endopeptidase (penicillin-binding protein 4)
VRAALTAAALALALVAPAAAVDRSPIAGLVRPLVGGPEWNDADAAALRANLDAIVGAAPTVRDAHVGLLVETADDGRVLAERNADDAFQPASMLKLLVGSVALERLGSAYAFSTTLVWSPPRLVLRGGGDPLLGARDLEAAADAARRAGVAGRVDLVLDASRHAGERRLPGWSVDDELQYYAPVLNGLPFEENVLHVTVRPGPTAGAVPTVALPPPLQPVPGSGCLPGPTALRFTVRTRTAAAGTPSTLDAERGRCGDVVLTGTVPAGAPSSLDVAVDEPERLARATLTDALRRRGIAVRPPPLGRGPIPGVVTDRFAEPPAGAVVWRHLGEPLTDLVADLWLPSDNFVAEQLLRELDTVQNRRAGTTTGGLALEAAWLRELGVDAQTVTLADGSGLSQYDRIAPRALAAILRRDWLGPQHDVVLDALPVGGRRGSLRTVMRDTPADGRVYAKTGSMSHVRGLAGYVATREHGTVILVLAVDDWLGAPADLDALWTSVCSEIAGTARPEKTDSFRGPPT